MKLSSALWLIILALLAGADVRADQSSQETEKLRLAIQQPLRLNLPPWVNATSKRLGIVTVAPPEKRGEMVRVAIPVGELTMRVANAVSNAQYRRAERQAREEVRQAIKDFQAQQQRQQQ